MRLIDADLLGLTDMEIIMCDGDYKEALKMLIDKIEHAPTIDLAEPHWIPCSETVNIPGREVLCCDRYGEELIGWLSYSDDQWLCESDGEMMYDPIAWREKPEPWRGDAE